jgi:phosphate:Na+ symporter
VTAFIGHATTIAERDSLDLKKQNISYTFHAVQFRGLKLTRYISENSDYTSINKKKKFFIKTKEEKYDFLETYSEQVFYLELRPKLQSEHS